MACSASRSMHHCPTQPPRLLRMLRRTRPLPASRWGSIPKRNRAWEGSCATRAVHGRSTKARGAAALRGQLQASHDARFQGLRDPGEHDIAGTGDQSLFAGPLRALRRPHHQYPGQVHAARRKRGRIGHQGWRNPCAPAGLRSLRHRRQQRHQQAQFPAAQVGGQNLDQTRPGPTAARQARIEFRKTRWQRLDASKTATAPDARMFEQLGQRIHMRPAARP